MSEGSANTGVRKRGREQQRKQSMCREDIVWGVFVFSKRDVIHPTSINGY